LTDQSRDRLAAFEEQYAGYQVYDSDGEKVGSVDDLFVDDNDDLKYIGVKVEHSETRSILIPMDAARVDEERRVIEVLQPKGKVHEGPTFDDEKEITLGFEEQVRGHYGLRGLQSSVGGDVGQERGHAEREEGSERRPDTVSSVFNREDGGYREHPASEEHIGTTHRDAETGFEGYQVYDRHYERIGKVDDLFLDESDRPEYIGVKTGFLGTSSTLIPMDIVRVNDKRQLVEIEADKDTIKEGPTFGDDREITPEFEQRVLNYYQLETARASAEKKAYGPYYSNATSDERVDVLPGERAGAHDHLGERQQENEIRGADRERSDLGDEELRSEEEGRARASERQSERVNVRKRMRSDRQRRAAPNLPVDESEATAEEVPSTTDVPPRTESGLSGSAPASGEIPTGDVPSRTAQSGWETPPPKPRQATPAEMSPPSEAATPERAVPPDASAEGADIAKSVEAPRGERASDSPREAPAPGEERPERRGEEPAADIPREAPPPGEERPERRTP
jgi:sporulation protein YlmC with PRC-barrel domain